MQEWMLKRRYEIWNCKYEIKSMFRCRCFYDFIFNIFDSLKVYDLVIFSPALGTFTCGYSIDCWFFRLFGCLALECLLTKLIRSIVSGIQTKHETKNKIVFSILEMLDSKMRKSNEKWEKSIRKNHNINLLLFNISHYFHSNFFRIPFCFRLFGFWQRLRTDEHTTIIVFFSKIINEFYRQIPKMCNVYE